MRVLVLRGFAIGVSVFFLVLMLNPWIAQVGWQFDAGTSYKDTLQFYTGGTLVRTREAQDLYDLDIQKALQDRLLPVEYYPHPNWGVLPFLSPPFVALAIAPLTLISLPGFYLLTGLVQIVSIAALVLTLQRSVTDWPEGWRLVLATLVIAWLPISWALHQGQASILLALSFASAYVALRNGHHAAAGVLLSALWIKPQYAVLILPALLVWQNWRAATAFAASSLGLLAISWLTVGTEVLVGYGRLLSGIEEAGALYGMFPAFYNTVSGLLVRLTGSSGVPWLLLVLVLVAAMLWNARHGFGPRSYATLILATVLISLHTHSYDLVILLPAAALGWDALRERPNLAIAWAVVWFALDLALFALAIRGTQFEDAPLVTVPFMLLAFAVLLIPRAVRTAALVPARA